jgi:hypothetical protein
MATTLISISAIGGSYWTLKEVSDDATILFLNLSKRKSIETGGYMICTRGHSPRV